MEREKSKKLAKITIDILKFAEGSNIMALGVCETIKQSIVEIATKEEVKDNDPTGELQEKFSN